MSPKRMHDEVTNTLQTLGLLYETAFGIDRWPQALDAITQLIGGNGAVLFVNDATASGTVSGTGSESGLQIAAMSTRYGPQHAHQYLTSLTEADELRWVHDLDALPPRTLRTDLQVWPDRAAYDAMPTVRFMRQMNLYHRVGVRPCAHGGWKDALTVLFDKRRAGIQPAEAERLALLLPYVARAIERQRPFKLLQARFSAVLSVLNRLGVGVLILNDSAEIIVANEEAERVLDDGDALLRTPDSHLTAVDAATATRLAQAIAQSTLAAKLERKHLADALHVERLTQREPYIVEIAPFRDDGVELGSAFVGVLMVIIDADHRDMVTIDALVDSYRLTPAETLVCSMIARGMSLREIAESRDVSLETIKSQSRSIYGKTQTSNRRELVQRAHSIRPPLRDGAGKRIN